MLLRTAPAAESAPDSRVKRQIKRTCLNFGQMKHASCIWLPFPTWYRANQSATDALIRPTGNKHLTRA